MWLSHKHADHILGLTQLLCMRARSSSGSCSPLAPGTRVPLHSHLPPLLVVGPAEVGRWLAALAPLHPGWSYSFMHCR